MKPAHLAIRIFLTLLPAILFAQLPTASLRSNQPANLFKPVIITTTTDSTIVGFGFVNPIDFSDLIFTKERPQEDYVESWEHFKDIRLIKMVDRGLRTLEPLDFRGRTILNELVGETENHKIFKSVSRYSPDVYFIQPKDKPNVYKQIVLRKQKLFTKTAKKVFKDCPPIITEIENNNYSNNPTSLIELVEKFEENCGVLE
ncbi:hypothetical protein E0K83_16040 [Gramella sp. BOM4]|nr:hypothetical protein [Christiangramia bathymodioli]